MITYIYVVSISDKPCTNNTLRLAGGDGVKSGRVEVCVRGAWGTVCSNNFNSNAAAQVCGSLGLQSTCKNVVTVCMPVLLHVCMQP